MSAKPSQKSIPSYYLVFFDLIGAIYSVGPGILAWGTLIFAISRLTTSPFLIPFLLVSPFFLAMVFIALLRVLRFTLPALKAGTTQVGLNRGSIAWYGNLALNRSLKVSGLRYLLNASYILKFLTYRALGARMGFGVHTPMEFTMADLPLIEIGEGTTFGENVYISCHLFMGDCVVLKPTRIGKNCFVGMNTSIHAGSQIEDGAWVGFGNLVSGEHVQRGQKVVDTEWRNGSPQRAEKIQRAIAARAEVRA